MELSADYRAHAQSLRERIRQLQAAQAQTQDEGAQLQLADRIHTLQTMWREARDLAVLTERYYERGYRRNAKYTL